MSKWIHGLEVANFDCGLVFIQEVYMHQEEEKNSNSYSDCQHWYKCSVEGHMFSGKSYTVDCWQDFGILVHESG